MLPPSALLVAACVAPNGPPRIMCFPLSAQATLPLITQGSAIINPATKLRPTVYNQTTSSSHAAAPSPGQGNAIIDPTAKIGQGCLIGPNVAIGKL